MPPHCQDNQAGVWCLSCCTLLHSSETTVAQPEKQWLVADAPDSDLLQYDSLMRAWKNGVHLLNLLGCISFCLRAIHYCLFSGIPQLNRANLIFSIMMSSSSLCDPWLLGVTQWRRKREKCPLPNDQQRRRTQWPWTAMSLTTTKYTRKLQRAFCGPSFYLPVHKTKFRASLFMDKLWRNFIISILLCKIMPFFFNRFVYWSKSLEKMRLGEAYNVQFWF